MYCIRRGDRHWNGADAWKGKEGMKRSQKKRRQETKRKEKHGKGRKWWEKRREENQKKGRKAKNNIDMKREKKRNGKRNEEVRHEETQQQWLGLHGLEGGGMEKLQGLPMPVRYLLIYSWNSWLFQWACYVQGLHTLLCALQSTVYDVTWKYSIL